MIPRVENFEKLKAEYQLYVNELKSSAFAGDVEDRYEARLLCATDNSVYQLLPQCVIFPKTASDIQTALSLASKKCYKSIVFAPRGGGTGTNGQSLTHGIMIDCSRYMKGVSELNPQQREVTVESGVIKDELNDLLREHRLFFSPELSTSNRATIGGMISNDAAGQGSNVYGRTSNHVKSVSMVLADGSLETFKEVSGDELKSCLSREGFVGDIYRKCYRILKDNNARVKEVFPKLNRFMTGYDLDHAYDASTDTLNLARLICGAEGTLGVVTSITLDLTPMPEFRALLVIKYDSFDSALRHAMPLIRAGALSVETVDSKVLNLAKKDPVWYSVREYIQEVEGFDIQGVNIVEFAGADAKAEQSKMQSLYEDILKQTQKEGKERGGIIGAQITDSAAGIAAVYGMRKKAVGLLGSAASKEKLVAFTEDTVVPPEHLADYILEFRALLDSMGVDYGMFGHVDVGLMHVRPALDLTKEEDKQKLITISNEVVKLIDKYKGQMWGEHGRGYRSCFGEIYFKDLYPVAREIKAIFDMDNRLNPGKICVPLGIEGSLVALDSVMRGDLDRQIPISIRENFENAMNCNGNGQCFSYQQSSLMCPSYRYTKDHVRSPKGYAGLMREWLRLMAKKGININAMELETLTRTPNPVHFARRVYNTICGKDDFNKAYYENIKTCVACKSCKTQCPAHVNVADLNSRFLAMYYDRYLRPSMDLVALHAEVLLPLMSRYPKLFNLILKSSLNAYLVKKIFKFVDLPLFSSVTLHRACQMHNIALLDTDGALKSKADVVIVTDPFTASYEVDGLVEFALFLQKVGYSVVMLKPYVNGKLRVVRGDRRGFINFAAKQASRLQRLSDASMTLVGFDPALTICYRDEYKELLGSRRGDFTVYLPEEFLEAGLKEGPLHDFIARHKDRLKALSSAEDFGKTWYLFAHCTEQALLPRAALMWQQAMSAFGLTLLPIPVSCCGMAGMHGHMAHNQDESYSVWKQGWKKELDKRDFDACLVTGFSCRSQVLRMEGRAAKHPVYVLYDLVEKVE